MHNRLLVVALIITLIIVYTSCQQTISNEKQDIHQHSSTAQVSKYARQLTDVKFEPTEARLERGKYLANGVLRCFHCHAPVDSSKPGYPYLEDKLGGGRLIYKTDSTHLYAPNISPDKETGAGTWTDDMLVRAIRNGIGHDGRALTYMPFWTFAEMGDEDLASLIVYLRSIPPVKNELPGRALGKESEKQLDEEERLMEVITIPQPDTSSLLARGRYLVTIGECEGCHTAWYARNPGFFGGGNPIANDDTDSVIVSANISSDVTGVGGWDDETFIRVMRTGKAGTLHSSMPWVAFRNISDADLSAMLAALKTLPPVKHQIVNSLKASPCEVCGVKHGYGNQNKITPLTPIKINTSIYPAYVGTYTNKYKESVSILYKDKKLWVNMGGHDDAKEIELIPISANSFHGSGLPSPISFKKDSSGKVAGFINQDLVPLQYAKVQ